MNSSKRTYILVFLFSTTLIGCSSEHIIPATDPEKYVDIEQEFDEISARNRSQIEKLCSENYSKNLVAKKLRGEVRISFTITVGETGSRNRRNRVKILKSSGYEVLDKLSIRCVESVINNFQFPEILSPELDAITSIFSLSYPPK